MQEIIYEKEVEKIEQTCFSAGHIAIFGTGAVGEMIYHAVRQLNLPFCFFIVNDGHSEDCVFLNEKVYELSEVSEGCNYSDLIIIYGIRDRGDGISGHLCREFGDKLIFSDYRIVLYALLNRFFTSYLTNKGIDLSSELICVDQYKLINPFLKGFNQRLEWLTAMSDIILPPLFSDYSYVTEGIYENPPVVLNQGDIILDCGANVGAFSAVAAAKGCKVYAFEPIPTVVQQLKDISSLYPDDIEIIQSALGNKTGMEIFYMDESYSAISTMCRDIVGNDSSRKEISVNITTVDEFVCRNHLATVNFIKADIEGAERFMLEGAADTLRHFKPRLSIATYHLKDDKEVLEEIIMKINPSYKIIHKWKMLYAF